MEVSAEHMGQQVLGGNRSECWYLGSVLRVGWETGGCQDLCPPVKSVRKENITNMLINTFEDKKESCWNKSPPALPFYLHSLFLVSLSPSVGMFLLAALLCRSFVSSLQTQWSQNSQRKAWLWQTNATDSGDGGGGAGIVLPLERGRDRMREPVYLFLYFCGLYGLCGVFSDWGRGILARNF